MNVDNKESQDKYRHDSSVRAGESTGSIENEKSYHRRG